MSKTSKFERRRKKRRREKNRREREANVAVVSSEVRLRNPFKAKARRGDEAVLEFAFDDAAVPFDPEDPALSATLKRLQEAAALSAALKRLHKTVEAWAEAGAPTSGEA
jgi:hypothetical protein